MRVIEGGNFLAVTVRWTVLLVDLKKMHEKFLTDLTGNYQTYHPEYAGFHEAMKGIK